MVGAFVLLGPIDFASIGRIEIDSASIGQASRFPFDATASALLSPGLPGRESIHVHRKDPL